MSINKNDLKIGQSELDKTKISRLSDRPNVGSAVGGNALSPTQMKKKYDEAAELIVKRFNALIDALAGYDEDSNRIDGVADLIMTGLAEGYSLADLLTGLADGSAAQLIHSGIDEYTVKGYLQYLAMQLANKLEVDRIDVTVEGVAYGQEPTISAERSGEGEDKRVLLKFSIPEGKQGERGPSGVYVGSGEMPDDCNVQVDPESEELDYYEVAQETGDSEVLVMSQKATTEAIKAGVGGALKGTASGIGVVRIDDVSRNPHNMSVKVSGVEDASAVRVMAWGKNFFENDTTKIEKITYTGKGGQGQRYGYALRLPAGTYSVHAEVGTMEQSYNTYIYSVLNRADGSYKEGAKEIVKGKDKLFSHKITIESGDIYYVYNGIGDQGKGTTVKLFEGFKVQIEPGSTVTAFEPYVAPTEYTVNADGSVDGVTSVAPTTTLICDTEGVTIEVEYGKDLNQAYDELKNAIIELGGNV